MGLNLVKTYPDENFHDVICSILERLNCSNDSKKYFDKYNKLKSQ